MSTCMVHPGLSKYAFAGIPVKGINKLYKYTIFKFKCSDINIYKHRYIILKYKGLNVH